jgi:phospholipase/carboxylesterase
MLQELFEGAGSKVTVHWENNGHQLSRSEVAAAADWYEKHFKN